MVWYHSIEHQTSTGHKTGFKMRDYALEGAGQAEVTYQYYYYRNHSRTVLTCQFIYLDDRTVSEYSNILYFPPPSLLSL